MHASVTTVLRSAISAGLHIERLGEAGEDVADERHVLGQGRKREVDSGLGLHRRVVYPPLNRS